MSVRVRFAPSPTGVLHIGSLRTALFNWLYARHNGGKFLLRIEDTDKLRSTDENTKLIFEILEWLGIDWDETPVIQSQRFQRHVDAAKELVKQGKAYYCRCTTEELADKKNQSLADGISYKYDRTCRDKNLISDSGSNFVIRLKSDLVGKTTLNDLVQGEIVVENSQLDDLVLVRSDGTPTYMLSVVVDDHDMDITHVIRGDDHLTNTFRQIQIYQSFGWKVPSFAHIPLIYGPDGAKLSKRHGAASAIDYLDLGYLPETILNYLLRLGWSHGDDEIISKTQAAEWFSLESVGKSPARFDMNKLQNLNAHYIKQRDNDSLLNYLEQFFNFSMNFSEKAMLLMGMDSLKERAKTIVDLIEGCQIYMVDPQNFEDQCKKYATSVHIKMLSDFSKILLEHKDNILESELLNIAKNIAQNNGVKLVEIAQAIRAALSGKLVSPSVFEVIEILGVEITLRRIKKYIETFNQ